MNEDVDSNNVDISNTLFKLINNCKENDDNNGINISNDVSSKSEEINDKNDQPNDLYTDPFQNKKIRADNMSKFERTFKQNENKIKNDSDKKCGADLYSK